MGGILQMTKQLFLILFPFLLSAQIYVNPNYGAGTSDGGMTTPYRFLDNYDYWENGRADGVDWAVDVSPGDTIYIEGGADSVIYTPNAMYGQNANPDGITIGYSPNATRSYSFLGDPPYDNPVIITKDWRSGHNGKVIFDLDSNDDQNRAFTVMGVVNVKFVDITFRNTRDPVVDIGSSVIRVGASQAVIDSMIAFDNCEFRTYGAGGTFGIATTKCTVENSIIDVPYNVLVNGQDPFGLSSGHGGHTFNNNIIIVRNGYEIEPPNTTGTGVTVGSNYLTDTGLNMVTDYHVNNSVWAQGFYLQITSNTSNTFYGAEWIFDEYVNTTGNGVTTTDTSLSHTEGESWNENILIGAIITCGGNTLTITSNSGTDFYGSGGWSPETPASGLGYRITGAPVPPSGTGYKWSMGGPHKDIMQFSNIGMAADTVVGGVSNQPRLPITISNNLILDPVSLGTGWNALIYNYGWSYTPSIEFRIYNNIIVSAKEKTTPGALVIGRLDTNRKNTLKIFNNTFITRSGVLTEWSVDSLIFKNNLVICDTNLTINYNLTAGHTLTQIDYNLLAEQGGYDSDSTEQFATYGPEYTLGEWVDLGYDANSIIADSDTITFVNKFGETKASYYTSSGAGLAENLWDEYPFLRTDALGNARSELGTWDIGALIYSSGAVVDTLPDPFTYFDDITNVNLNTLVSAQTGDLLNFDSAWVSIDRGYYNINGLLPWKNAGVLTKVFPNDDVYLRDTSASTYLTSKSIVLTVGSRSQTWTHTTRGASTGQIIRPDDVVKTSDGNIFTGADVAAPPSQPDTIAPSPPTSFVAVGGAFQTQFQTSWTNPTGTDSIYYYEGSSNDTTTMTLVARLGAVQSYLRTGRTANTTYWCAVKAVDDSGNVSYFSNTDSATTLTNPEGGTPLQNLKMAYLTQSTAAHLFDHSTVGNAGTTSVPLQVAAYNDANNLNGYDSISVIRIDPDYPACGDMIWDWWAVFWNKDLFGCNAEYIVDDWLTDTTYSILQVTFGSASGALYDYYGTIDTTATAANKYYGNNYRYFIRQMVYVMEQYPDKYFVLWTLMPPTVSYLDSTDLVRATQFCTWMTDTLQAGLDSYGAFPNNVMIYDVHTLLDSSHYLPRSYADGYDDPHPNAAAASVFAPDFVTKVFDKARAYRRPD